MKHSPYISWAKKHHDVEYNLASSGMPRPSLDKLVPNPQQILDPVDHENGWPPLMKKIASRYEVNINQVVPVHSGSLANHLVCALLLDSGDEVLVESPVYEPLLSLPKYFNASVKRFNRKADQRYQPDPSQIESLASENTKLIILSNLHNPSGMLIDEPVLWQLIDIAEQRNCHILVDEAYLELLYPSGERTAAKYNDKIITTRSLTKAYGLDDLRVGWITAESILAERIRKLQDLFMTSMASPSERLGLMTLENGDELLNQNISQLKYNLQLVDEFVVTHEKLSWQKPDFGSIGFVNYAGGNVDMLSDYLLENHETLIAPGRFFGMDTYFRVGWSLPTETLQTGLKNLDKAISELS
jgi:aspartate/methionine/tyrosine aminotransferase